MAGAIASAFNDAQLLTVEAGTGTGKSMAYLVPAIKWAVKNYGLNGRVIVSTNTKNLQEVAQETFSSHILNHVLRNTPRIIIVWLYPIELQ